MKKQTSFLNTVKRLRQKNIFSHENAVLNKHLETLSKLYDRYGFELRNTCFACPEQYEVYFLNQQIAYFTLRHGEFTIDFLGETIHVFYPKGDGFFYDDERMNYLSKALKLIISKTNIKF